jgi:hypothetical protein
MMLLLTSYLSVWAAGPTVPASNLVPGTAEGNKITFTFNRGNGAARIVVVREGTAITASPVNSKDYTANGVFETAGTAFESSNGYVVNKTIGGSLNQTATISVTNLKPATQYYINVFEYNGTGISTEYLATSPSFSMTTLSAPTQQTHNITFPVAQLAGSSIAINWDNGNGAKRVILARKGAPVNAVPQDLTDYNHSTVFGSGNAINTDNFVVYDGAGITTPLTDLEPNTTYYFAAFECNGTTGPVYMQPGATASVTTHDGPTKASGTISFSAPIEGDNLSLSFGKGNGKYQLIIAREGQPVTAVPQNGQTYTGNPNFKDGTEIAPGEFVVNSVNNDRLITNLKPSTVYHFRIYEYDVTNSGATYYLTSSYSQNSRSTAIAPATPASGAYFDNINGTGATLKYAVGSGTTRLIIMKAGSPVDATPADLTRYNSGSQTFGNGQQITPGNYVIGYFTGTAINITGLSAGTTYYAAVYEYNGNKAPVYASSAATATVTIPNEPTGAATSLSTSSVEGNSFSLSWIGGNGSHRLVIARKGAPVTAHPADGATYSSDNRFQYGFAIGTDEYVVYDGLNRIFNFQNLDIASTYHFAIFEYNLTAGVPDYLTSSFFTGTATTVSAPVTQATVGANNVQTNQATITYAKGDGTGRLFIMRAGSPVDVTPQDLTDYTNASSVFGTREIGSGNYLVYKTSGISTFNATNLAPNTTYHIAVFEFNGSSAPVFKKPAGTYSFTTAAGNTVVIPPTTASGNPRPTLVDGNKLSLAWDAGDGANRIVVMRQGSPVSFTPVDGNTYAFNSDFSSGTNLGNGQYVVYNSVGGSTAITNLAPNTTYHFAIFEYNGSGTNTRYLATALTFQQASATAPTGTVTGFQATAANSTASLSWVGGPGKGRLVVMKEGGVVTATPADLIPYNASPAFTNGVQIASGEYVIMASNSNSVLVTGLNPLKKYYFKIFEYNGIDAPVYNTTTVISGGVSASATLPLKWLYFTAKQNNDGIKLEWATTEEKNTKYFVVERNTNNGFVAVDTVQAKSSAGNNYYDFTDRSTYSGKVTYRLKQVDIDNDFEYSKQVTLQTQGGPDRLRIYPNPASGQCRISLPGGLTKATVHLYDTRGMLVKTIQVADKQVISLAGIVSGLYHIVLRGQNQTYSEQLIVR